MPYRAILAAHEHHMKTDLTGYPRTVRPRELGIYSRIVAVADGFDAATTRRSYQTVPIEPDQVLREMWQNPKRGYDIILVKALINLIGIYPVGTCVILDTFEVAIVAAPDPEGQQLNRPLVRVAVESDGGTVPPPGNLVSLTEQRRGRQLPALDREGDQSLTLRPHRRRLLCLIRPSRRTLARPPRARRHRVDPLPDGRLPRPARERRGAPQSRTSWPTSRGRRAVQRPARRRAYDPALARFRRSSRA